MTTHEALNILLAALTVVVDTSAVLLLAWGIILANRRRSSLRHAVWVAAFAALLLLPLLLLSHGAIKSIPIAIHTTGAVSASSQIAVHSVPAQITDWPATARLLIAIWALGASLLLVWIGLAVQALRSLFRSSISIDWREGEFARLSAHFNLRRRVALRICRPGLQLSALTWGARQPVILLPADAATWSDEERESVLLHELAHIHRWDSSYQLLAAFATSIFWFHPAVWLAAWAMRGEAEEAADDAVLRSGVRPSDYASQLLVLATRYGNGRRARPSLGVFMMKKSGIERRIRSIVDGDRRRNGPSVTQAASIGVVALLIVFFVTEIRPVLKTAPDARESLYNEVLFVTTRHQRDPQLHKMAMIRQWGAKKAGEAGFRDDTMRAATKAEPLSMMRVTSHTASGPRHMTASRVVVVSQPIDSMPEDGPTVAAERPASAPLRPRVQPMAFVASIPMVASMPLRSPVQTVSSRIAPPAAPVEPTTPSGLSAPRCSVPRFHAVVAGPEVKLTLKVAKGQGYSVDCTNPNRPNMVMRKNGDELEFGVDCGGDTDKELTAQVVDGVLYLRGSSQLEVVTTTPFLDRLDVTGDSIVSCSGMSQRNFQVVASGHSTVDVNGHSAFLQLDLSGNSVLRGSNLNANQLNAGVSGNSSMELGGEFHCAALHAEADSSLRASGHVRRLDLTGSGGASVDCSGLEALHVEAAASAGVAIRVFASKSLNASADHGSQIQYLGKPSKVTAAPDETSKIYF